MNQLELISKISSASNLERAKKYTLQLGVKTFLSKLQEPFDAEKVAKKCVANPKSKYFGMNWETVVAQWTSKADYKANTGISLDNYIGYKLDKLQIDKNQFEDENTKLQANQFDLLYESKLSHLQFIAREKWLNYNHNNIRILGKFDALFANKHNKLLLIDWKQNDEISTHNDFNKLKGPCNKFDDCKWVMFSLQLYSYRYIFEKYDISVDACGIGHITTSSNSLMPTAFPYDKGLMKEVFDYCSENV